MVKKNTKDPVLHEDPVVEPPAGEVVVPPTPAALAPRTDNGFDAPTIFAADGHLDFEDPDD
jgi:hypothetical protein